MPHLRTLIGCVVAVIIIAACQKSDNTSSDKIIQRDAVDVKKQLQKSTSSSGYRSESVMDYADILGSYAEVIDQRARTINSDLGIDVRVVTRRAKTDSLLFSAGNMFRELNVGQQAKVGGLLILLNPEKNQARIEVSYSLEGIYTDLLVGRITRNQLAPYASYRVIGMAVMDVTDFLYEYAFDQAIAGNLVIPDELQITTAYKNRQALYLSGGGGHQVTLPEFPVDHDFKKPISSEKLHRYKPHTTPEATAQSWLNVYRDFAWYPKLDVLTKESQVMRDRYPFALYEESKRLQQMERLQPYQIYQQGEYAVARSANYQEIEHWVPILMHRINGVWEVDVAETYKNLYTPSPGKTFYQRNNSHPYTFAFTDIWADIHDYVTPLGVDGSLLAEKIDGLSNASNSDDLFELAELLYRNAYVSAEALYYYEQAAKKAGEKFQINWVYAQRLIYEGAPKLALGVLEKLDDRAHALRGDAYYKLRNYESAKRYYSLAAKQKFDRGRARRGLKRVKEKLQ